MSAAVNGTTKLCGVMGDPIGHTLSPVIHNFLAEKLGENLVYVPFHVPAEKLQDAVRGAWALQVQGMNVTIPHKEKIMTALCAVDEDARIIGAVNTLVYSGDGYRGCNTDWIGLRRSLEEAQIEIGGKHVLFLGAGGVANAAAYLCGKKQAASVTILNRTRETARLLAERMGGYFRETVYTFGELADWRSLPREDYLCFQTTPVGMYPHGDRAVIEDPEFYKKLAAAADMIYRPKETLFLKLAKNAGAKTCNGLGMFIWQAAEAFTKFTGRPVPDETGEEAGRMLEKILEKDE